MIVNTSAFSSDSANLSVFNPEPEVAESATVPEQDQQQAEVASNEVSEQPTNSEVEKPFDEQRFWREIELISQLSDVKKSRDEIKLELSLANNELEEAKNTVSEIRARVGELEGRLREDTDEFMSLAEELCIIAVGAVAQLPKKEVDASTEEQQSAEQQEDESWRKYPTVELLKGISGNKKKKESIAELAPTLGDLQDLRIEASKKNLPFAEKLPDRCGEKIAQQVEDLIIDYIEKYRKGEHNPNSKAKADELLAEIESAAEQNGWTLEDCKPKETDNASLRAGYLAFQEGQPHTDVVLDDAAAAKQWMIGWFGAKLLKQQS